MEIEAQLTFILFHNLLLKNRGNRAFHLGETEFVLKKLEGIGLHFIVCT